MQPEVVRTVQSQPPPATSLQVPCTGIRITERPVQPPTVSRHSDGAMEKLSSTVSRQSAERSVVLKDRSLREKVKRCPRFDAPEHDVRSSKAKREEQAFANSYVPEGSPPHGFEPKET